MSSPLKLRRDTATSSVNGEFYLVHEVATGKKVGRIFNGFPDLKSTSGKPWFWGLDFFEARGASPFYGHAATKELAMAEFRTVWNSRPER